MLAGTSWSSAKLNSKFCTWVWLTPCITTSWGLINWKQACREQHQGPDIHKVCALTGRVGNSTMGCIRKSITSRLRVLLPLHSAWVRHLHRAGLVLSFLVYTKHGLKQVSKGHKGDKRTERSDVWEAEIPGTVQPREGSGQISSVCINNLWETIMKTDSSLLWGNGHKLKHRKFHLKVRK